MKDYIIIKYGEDIVRIIRRNGKFWFVAIEVCKICGLKNANECSMEEGEADLAESLWIAQAACEDARQTLDGF